MSIQMHGQMLPVSVAAELLGVSGRTVRRLLDKQELSPIRINRRVLISYADVVTYANSKVVTKCDAIAIANKILERF